MTCPVEVTDHTSALIAADWYEEQGRQHYADALREQPSKENTRRTYDYVRTGTSLSGSVTGVYSSPLRLSRCGTSCRSAKVWSSCSARGGSQAWSLSHSRRGRYT